MQKNVQAGSICKFLCFLLTFSKLIERKLFTEKISGGNQEEIRRKSGGNLNRIRIKSIQNQDKRNKKQMEKKNK